MWPMGLTRSWRALITRRASEATGAPSPPGAPCGMGKSAFIGCFWSALPIHRGRFGFGAGGPTLGQVRLDLFEQPGEVKRLDLVIIAAGGEGLFAVSVH